MDRPDHRQPIRVLLLVCLGAVVAGCGSGIEVPDLSLPEISVPDLTLPDLPDLTVPDLTLPGGSEDTAPPATDPATTRPPATEPPVSGPSTTQSPDLDPPTTGPPVTEAPTTEVPSTEPATTAAPPTEPQTQPSATAPETSGPGTDSVGTETTVLAAPGTSAGESEDEGSGPLLWLILGILVVLGLLAALVIHRRSAARREWEAKARTAYLEGRWIADQAALRGAGDPLVGERLDGAMALVHELELDSPTPESGDAIRRVGAALVELGRPEGDAGAARAELIEALDRLGDHLGR